MLGQRVSSDQRKGHGLPAAKIPAGQNQITSTPQNLLSFPAGKRVASKLVEMFLPPVIWGCQARGCGAPPHQHHPEQQHQPCPSQGSKWGRKVAQCFGLGFHFSSPFIRARCCIRSGESWGGGALPWLPSPPTMHVARLSVCLSVPIWQQAAAPLPVVCSSCLSKAFPSPPRSSWRFSAMAKTRSARPPTPRRRWRQGAQAGRVGRESRQGE